MLEMEIIISLSLSVIYHQKWVCNVFLLLQLLLIAYIMCSYRLVQKKCVKN